MPLRFVPVFVLALSLLGCGLFGDEDNPLDGTLTYEADGPADAQVTVTRTYFYTDESCKATRSDTDRLPLEGTLDPEKTADSGSTTCENVELSSFDGVRVAVTLPPTPGESPGLTLKLLSDGNVIDDATAPTEGRTWIVEAGRIPIQNQQPPI